MEVDTAAPATETHSTTIDDNDPTELSTAPVKIDTVADLNLAHAVLLLLKRTGLVPWSLEEDNIPTSTSVLNPNTHSQTGWLPLLPTADASFLLSTIPPSLRPGSVPFAVPTAPATSPTRRQLIDTLARLALEPSLTMEIMMRFRPLSPVLWGRWLEMLGLDSEGAWREGDEREGERAAVEKVLGAMVRVLGVFENVFP